MRKPVAVEVHARPLFAARRFKCTACGRVVRVKWEAKLPWCFCGSTLRVEAWEEVSD
jgi:hypothetical protein